MMNTRLLCGQENVVPEGTHPSSEQLQAVYWTCCLATTVAGISTNTITNLDPRPAAMTFIILPLLLPLLLPLVLVLVVVTVL